MTQESKVDLSRVEIPGARLLVRRVKPEDKSKGGIIIPDAAQAERNLCEVARLGEAGFPPSVERGLPVKGYPCPGDEVIVSRAVLVSGQMPELGEDMHVIDLANVLAIVRKERS